MVPLVVDAFDEKICLVENVDHGSVTDERLTADPGTSFHLASRYAKVADLDYVVFIECHGRSTADETFVASPRALASNDDRYVILQRAGRKASGSNQFGGRLFQRWVAGELADAISIHVLEEPVG